MFRLCQANGSLEEARVRDVVQRLTRSGHPDLKVLSQFQRFVRLDRAAHSARIESAAPLPADVRTRIESGLTQRYGRDLATTFAENAALLGGVRVTVGSDVYDGSIRGRLEALEERF